MILLIDNYDSFTYNVYQMVGEHNQDITVIRNDKLTLDTVAALSPSHIILSPGPGYPADAGLMPQIIRCFHNSIPMLGICLGHQALAESFGASIVEAKKPYHGKSSAITLTAQAKNCPILRNLPRQINAGRYHSLTVDQRTLPACFDITSLSDDDQQIMSISHRTLPLYGLQFHPESILSDFGSTIFKNFLANNYL
ncbi:MAG: aminodeoxychorismate/anthranilate synthase component II [Eubacteriales bacterium]|nr:aminodeoxychorismate/anthranilate synthase component II [Eubacteriales bacterium]MDD3196824.1 aminodeoxychorismate/anthranilate synthase component II [Eubacteriales bacterium]MDD3504301.1 aminodeoxychorismate/anthranilate synthase component II [Eubacteriales bacterium]MDD4682199.1 aminodeoxychorismate/anthranilate synthase component II [Eubacteriales bacterium]